MLILKIILLVIISSVLYGCDHKTATFDRLSENLVKVGVMVIDSPKAVNTNLDFNIKVKVRNVGQIAIPSLGKDGQLLQVGVTYHWKSTDEQIIVWDGLVTSLESDIELDQEQLVSMNIKAPERQGRYVLEIDLVQNSAFWFGAIGSQTARIMIDVV